MDYMKIAHMSLILGTGHDGKGHDRPSKVFSLNHNTNFQIQNCICL